MAFLGIFSLGNVITFLLCGALLVIFRLTDKKGKSLDAARNYARQFEERLKTDLSEFVDKKTQDIYGAAAIVETNKKAGAALLDNLNEKIAELKRDSEEVERTDALLAEYNSKLDDLKAMSAGVEANLARIQEESPIVDNALSRIEEADGRLRGLLERVAAVPQEIERGAGAAMERVSGEILKNRDELLASLSEERLRIERAEVERGAALEKERGVIEAMLRDAVDGAKERALKLEEDIYAEFRAESEERARVIREETEAKITALGRRVNELSASRDAFDDLYRAAKEKAEALERECAARLDGFNADFSTQAESLRAGLSALKDELDSLKKDAYAQTEESLKSFGAEFGTQSESLRSGLSALKDELDSLKKDAYARTEESLKLFGAEFADSLDRRGLDIEARFNAWKDEVEGRFAAFSGEADGRFASLAGEAEANFRKLETDLTESLRRSTEAFEERLAEKDAVFAEQERRALDIENKISAQEERLAVLGGQKEFFDKAEETKNALRREIEDMRSSIASLEEEKAALGGLESRIESINRMEGDISSKMSRFLSEQRRIDLMEEEFRKLLLVSQSVEEKLAALRSEDDALQEMQLRFRKLTTALDESEEKFQRIEKKNEVLDAANEGIDANFKKLQESEKTAKQTEVSISNINQELAGIRLAVDELAGEQKKALAAAEKARELDAELSGIEKRIADMQTARQWLADLETRMNEVNRDAHEMVKRLLKSEKGGVSAAEKGAPSLATRENVIKLKRQGWTNDEIAKSVNIAKSAVELILEMAPR